MDSGRRPSPRRMKPSAAFSRAPCRLCSVAHPAAVYPSWRPTTYIHNNWQIPPPRLPALHHRPDPEQIVRASPSPWLWLEGPSRPSILHLIVKSVRLSTCLQPSGPLTMCSRCRTQNADCQWQRQRQRLLPGSRLPIGPAERCGTTMTNCQRVHCQSAHHRPLVTRRPQ